MYIFYAMLLLCTENNAKKNYFFTVGKPIKVVQNDAPTQEEVDKLHSEYLTSLRQLYDDYNPIYGTKNIALNFT